MKSIKDIDFRDKTVILRVDYNVPISNGVVMDTNKIDESLETINYLLSNNARVIVMSHLGKVKSKEDMDKNSLLPVRDILSNKLSKDVMFCDELKGNKLESMVSNLKSCGVLLLENTRYMDYPDKLESGCDSLLSKYWASLGDVFVFDAFGSIHREHASTYGIGKYLPCALGFLVLREISELDKIKNERKTLLLGGSKVSDKLSMIKALLDKTDKVLVGGAMCATFLKSEGYNIGKTYVDCDKIYECKSLIDTGKIVFPVDVVCESGVKELGNISEEDTIYDIGPLTIDMFKRILDNKSLVLVNGTMGMYENESYENGTKEIFIYLKESNLKVVILGGDSNGASVKYDYTPYYRSTGGGASLLYLSGEEFNILKLMED